MSMRRWAGPKVGLGSNSSEDYDEPYHNTVWGDGEGAGYYWGNRLGDGYLSQSDWGSGPREYWGGGDWQ